MDAVGVTGLMVAAIRAEESKRADRLFEDPFADSLATDLGRETLVRYRAASPNGSVPIIEVRTRWYDEAVARAWAAGTRQFVILAAGMDARAYRLAWPAGTRVFELDQPAVLAAKARGIAGAEPRCDRVEIALDLRGEWASPLLAKGFDPKAPTMWLVEGLLQYLDRLAVETIFARIDALSASGSTVLFDCHGQSLLSSPFIAGAMQMMRELGAPWTFGTDDPGSLLSRWRSAITEPAVVGNAWKRWPFPAAPPGVPGVPRAYLVEASKP